ncbi:response regulator [Moritella marina]|uniref:response regulator n=1 Tax=Moritella marina TaxID=90736 RepID=UPI0037042BBB
MINKKIKMDTSIVEILERDFFDNFNISRLKDAYMDLCKSKSSVESRKIVYKQVLKLVKLGALVKEGDKHSHHAIYKKTDLFSELTFSKINQIAINNLEYKLHKYNVDMISTASESEEYLQLAKSFPNMEEQLKKRHHLASYESSKLLGQIKAVKTLLTLQEGL